MNVCNFFNRDSQRKKSIELIALVDIYIYNMY